MSMICGGDQPRSCARSTRLYCRVALLVWSRTWIRVDWRTYTTAWRSRWLAPILAVLGEGCASMAHLLPRRFHRADGVSPCAGQHEVQSQLREQATGPSTHITRQLGPDLSGNDLGG